MKNEGNKELPFCISFHTFFNKLSGDDDTFLCVPERYMMELTEELLPTGKMLDVTGKSFDLCCSMAVSKLDLDSYCTGIETGERALVEYFDIGLRIKMKATEEFTYVQVYTPKGQPFFCAEMQTCSTDAPNMDAQGFRELAHLLVVPPNEIFFRQCKMDF